MTFKKGETPFKYRHTKDDTIMLYYRGKHIKTLAGRLAQKFAEQAPTLDIHEQQLLMARMTGNFKRGNERPKGKHNRN